MSSPANKEGGRQPSASASAPQPNMNERSMGTMSGTGLSQSLLPQQTSRTTTPSGFTPVNRPMSPATLQQAQASIESVPKMSAPPAKHSLLHRASTPLPLVEKPLLVLKRDFGTVEIIDQDETDDDDEPIISGPRSSKKTKEVVTDVAQISGIEAVDLGMDVGVLLADRSTPVYAFLKFYNSGPRIAFRAKKGIDGGVKVENIRFHDDQGTDQLNKDYYRSLLRDQNKKGSKSEALHTKDRRRVSAPDRLSDYSIRERGKRSRHSDDEDDGDFMGTNRDTRKKPRRSYAEADLAINFSDPNMSELGDTPLNRVPRKKVPVKAAQEKWNALQPRKSGENMSTDVSVAVLKKQLKDSEAARAKADRANESLQSANKKLTGQVKELTSRTKKLEAGQSKGKDQQTLVDGRKYERIEQGPNVGKLLSTEWKAVTDGKVYKEWTILSESDLDMEFEGKGKTIKINGATYTQIPNGKNKGRLLDGGVVVDIGPQKYLKWAVREEIENTALTL